MVEHNLIQNPQLLYKLAKQLGLRQSHIAPALNEGIQAVVILDDITQGEQDFVTGNIRSGIMARGGISAAGTLNNFVQLFVTGGAIPTTTSYRIRRIFCTSTVPVGINISNRDVSELGNGIWAASDRREVPSSQIQGRFLAAAKADNATAAGSDPNPFMAIPAPAAGPTILDCDFRTGLLPILNEGKGICVNFFPAALVAFTFTAIFWMDERSGA